MEYPVTKAVIEHHLAGLRENEDRRDKIEARVTATLAKLPEKAVRDLTVADVFSAGALGAFLPGDVGRMARNPAFKVEPAISQLRRAEASYIEAHDAYLADRASGLRISEMEWAHGRLQIARAVYDGIISALPTTKRAAASPRPKATKAKAIKALGFAAFSEGEQQALRLAITDLPTAVERVDALVTSGQASHDLRILHAYLVDASRRDEVQRWLTSEISAMSTVTGRWAASEHADAAPDGIETLPGNREVDDLPVPAAIEDAIATLDHWLDTFPAMLSQFRDVGGTWRFDGEIRARAYARAYALSAEHPGFQHMITRRKSAHP